MARSMHLAFIVAALLWAMTAFAQPQRPIIEDHTPAPPAQDVPEALMDLALPQGALDRLTEVYSADEGVRSVHVAWLSGHRYLWRVELAEELTGKQYISLYVDTDAEPETGRQDAPGPELLVQWGPDYARMTEWMADGATTRDRGLRKAVNGRTLWATTDQELAVSDDQARFRFWITSPVGNVASTDATIPAEAPSAATRGIEVTTKRTEENATRFTITNSGDSERWIDFSAPVALEMDGPVQWFDAFNFTPHEAGDHALEQHGISAVLPLTAAWDGETGIALAFDPMDWYSEANASIRPADGGHEMRLGSRLALMPGEAHTFTVNVLRFDGDLGWRGAFDAYWQAFPDVYERARDIDPRFHEASAGGLYRSWSDPEAEEFCPDLIRRMRGHWEWGYAPAPRPGEWAVTDLSIGEWTRRGPVKKSASAESLEQARKHIRTWVHDTAAMADIAVAYYMHLKNVEKGLMEQHWSDSYFRDEQIEYIGYYAGVPCWFAYPMANSYGEYMERAIPLIAERFEPAGMAFDSVFGFIPHWGPSADRSPGTTFQNGRAFVGEGIGFAHQMDQVRAQETNGYRTAMVTNLKLPTLSADAVRTDTALLEFHPMNNPIYRERILRLRMLSGQIMFNWWHTYDPKYYRWIPWDELNVAQTIDAFQRLRDDILIHSLYYGAVPNGRFAVGVPKVMRAIPMLIEIADRGWQPVIGAEPAESDLLVSRYGEGATLALGVGNQGYETIEDRIIIDREQATGGADVALMGWSEGASTVTTSGDELTLEVRLPSRSIEGYRTVMMLPAGTASKMTVFGNLSDHQQSSVRILLDCPEAAEVPVTIWLPAGAREPTVLPTLGTIAMNRTDSGHLSARLALRAGANGITISWQPKVALQGDRDTLLDYPFVEDGRPNCNIVAVGDTGDLAFRVQ
ncbi:MAG: hypothetical protein GF393_11915, partial [Armatimonadia bacterium]|nr:hypothetical protein [Armatimonadia bacterium]